MPAMTVRGGDVSARGIVSATSAVQGAPQQGAGFAGAGGAGNEKAPPDVLRQAGRESSGDLLSRARGPGTIGDLRLNFRVRDGNGCDPHSITAETISCMEPNLLLQSPVVC